MSLSEVRRLFAWSGYMPPGGVFQWGFSGIWGFFDEYLLAFFVRTVKIGVGTLPVVFRGGGSLSLITLSACDMSPDRR